MREKSFEYLTGFESDLMDRAKNEGLSWNNYHTHLDRAYTNYLKYWEHTSINPDRACMLTLPQKQNLIGELHLGQAYTAKDLHFRMITELRRQHLLFNTKKVVSLIDATPDIGLRAIEAAITVKQEIEKELPGFEFGIGIQPIFGFKDTKKDSSRWDIFREVADLPEVEYLGGLPEKDDFADRMGFEEHIRRIIKLGIKLDKPVHIHLDQMNSPAENATERLLILLEREFGPLKLKNGQPLVWAVHVISPSCYDEYRHFKLLQGLKKYNVGVICCPRAAITTRHLRPQYGPLHPCIARIFDMIMVGIPVLFGSDNIADIFVPTGDGLMAREFVIIAEELRFSLKHILVKLGCGIELNKTDMNDIFEFLRLQNEGYREISPGFPFFH